MKCVYRICCSHTPEEFLPGKTSLPLCALSEACAASQGIHVAAVSVWLACHWQLVTNSVTNQGKCPKR